MDADQGGKAKSPLPIDTLNRHLVTTHRGAVVVARPPNYLTRDGALTFAAWVVAMAQTLEPVAGAPTFEEILAAVRDS